MGYNTEIITYPSSNGRDNVYAKLFSPDDTDFRAVVQISHGMCEYIDRYQDFAKFLCSKGFLVFGNDHIGHRHSVTDDSELGFFAEKDGYQCLIKDLYALTSIVRERYPGAPRFLLGHSMGSMIARCYLTEYGEGLSGAIISGTTGPSLLSRTGVKAANVACTLKGPRAPGKLLDRIAFHGYNDRFERRTANDWLSRDRAVVDAYNADPYCTFLFSNAAFRDVAHLNELCNAPSWAAKLPKDLPLFLMSGTEDPVGEYGEGVRRVYQMIKDAGLFDVTLQLYKGGRHEMLNETNRTEVYEDVYEWIRRKLP